MKTTSASNVCSCFDLDPWLWHSAPQNEGAVVPFALSQYRSVRVLVLSTTLIYAGCQHPQREMWIHGQKDVRERWSYLHFLPTDIIYTHLSAAGI